MRWLQAGESKFAGKRMKRVCVQSRSRLERAGMEPFMELSRREVGQASAGIGSPRALALRASAR